MREGEGETERERESQRERERNRLTSGMGNLQCGEDKTDGDGSNWQKAAPKYGNRLHLNTTCQRLSSPAESNDASDVEQRYVREVAVSLSTIGA